jgi:hypothetical protein
LLQVLALCELVVRTLGRARVLYAKPCRPTAPDRTVRTYSASESKAVSSRLVSSRLVRLVSSRLVRTGLVRTGLVSGRRCRLLPLAALPSMPCRVLLGRIVPTPHGPKWERAHVGAQLSGNGRRYGRIRLGTNEVGFEESVSFPTVRCNMSHHVAPWCDMSRHVARNMLLHLATCLHHVAACCNIHTTAPRRTASLRCCCRSTAAEPRRIGVAD